MPIILKYYGNITEVTKIEKTPSTVRVLRWTKPRTMYEKRRADSLIRTKNICMRRVSTAIAEFGCPLFVTLTFRGTAANAQYAGDSISIFQRRLRAVYPLAESIFVPEVSPRGRIHFHGLLFNVPLSLGDKRDGKRVTSYGTERYDRTLASLWREGFVDALQTDGSYRLAGYLSKYVTKGGGHILFAPMRLLRVSHGFSREIVVRDEYLISKVLSKLENKRPASHYEFISPFLGKISKTKYEND